MVKMSTSWDGMTHIDQIISFLMDVHNSEKLLKVFHSRSLVLTTLLKCFTKLAVNLYFLIGCMIWNIAVRHTSCNLKTGVKSIIAIWFMTVFLYHSVLSRHKPTIGSLWMNFSEIKIKQLPLAAFNLGPSALTWGGNGMCALVNRNGFTLGYWFVLEWLKPKEIPICICMCVCVCIYVYVYVCVSIENDSL